MSFEYVLHRMSWSNLIMYSSVLPGYDDIEENTDAPVHLSHQKDKQLGFGQFLQTMKGLQHER